MKQGKLPEVNKEKDNIIFIGSKPFMNYVTSVAMQFNTKNSPEVIIKARGKFISKAVDVSEVIRRRFLKDQRVCHLTASVNNGPGILKTPPGCHAMTPWTPVPRSTASCYTGYRYVPEPTSPSIVIFDARVYSTIHHVANPKPG